MLSIRRFGPIFVFVCGVLATLWMGSALRQQFGFPLDDSWIHQVVARNLVHYKVLGFLPGIHSSGTSSLLWTLILSLNYILLPNLSPEVYCLAINAILIGLICGFLKRNSDLDGLVPVEAWILGLAPLLNGNFLWLGLIGMEHVLFVALSVAAIYCWFSKGRGSLTLCAILIFLLAITRPEGLVLAPLLVLFYARAGRNRWAATTLIVIDMLGFGITCAVNWTATHTLLPLTMKGRSMLYFWPKMTFIDHAAFVGQVFQRLLAAYPLTLNFSHWFLPRITLFLGGICCLALVVWMLTSYSKQRMDRTASLLLWTLLLYALYLIKLPVPSPIHGGRYQAFAVLLMPPMLLIGAYRLLLWFQKKSSSDAATPAFGFRRQLPAIAILILAIGSATASVQWWKTILASGIEQINLEHGQMGTWLAANIPKDAIARRQVAVFDIGRIGWSIDGSLVDLGGLTDPTFFTYLQRGEVLDFLHQAGVTYVVLPGNGVGLGQTSMVLGPRWETMKKQKLITICDTSPAYEISWNNTNAAVACQTAYSVQF